ncbi:MAG: hypothetical protein LDL26_12665, partial [Caenispirillum bisanense]|nr:hypothetical protein [Caenispirillum bisanense]
MSGPASAAPAPESVAWRTLRTVTLGISVVVLVATVLSYWQVHQGLETQALGGLKTYVEERRARESWPFNQAGRYLGIAAEAYDRQLSLTGFPDVRHRFDILFETRPDGTWRLRDQVFRDTGVTGFIGKHVMVDDDLRRRLVAAYDVLLRFGPAWRETHVNLYAVLPENAVLMFWPDTPWALMAADWQLYGKLALVAEAAPGRTAGAAA